MQSKSKAATAELDNYFQTATYSHAANLADLVLTNYGNGYAWLKPCDDALEPDDALYWPTPAGRALTARWRAEVALYGHEIT